MRQLSPNCLRVQNFLLAFRLLRLGAPQVCCRAPVTRSFILFKEAGGRLYLHSNIHLKLCYYRAARSDSDTRNLTQAGLGLSQNSNIELSTMVALNRNDWQQVDQIMQHSQPVTDQIYEVAKPTSTKIRQHRHRSWSRRRREIMIFPISPSFLPL